jgi:hypothetical protein
LFFNELIRVIAHGHLHLIGLQRQTKARPTRDARMKIDGSPLLNPTTMIHNEYDVIVVGAGHAGNEAAPRLR